MWHSVLFHYIANPAPCTLKPLSVQSESSGVDGLTRSVLEVRIGSWLWLAASQSMADATAGHGHTHFLFQLRRGCWRYGRRRRRRSVLSQAGKLHRDSARDGQRRRRRSAPESSGSGGQPWPPSCPPAGSAWRSRLTSTQRNSGFGAWAALFLADTDRFDLAASVQLLRALHLLQHRPGGLGGHALVLKTQLPQLPEGRA